MNAVSNMNQQESITKAEENIDKAEESIKEVKKELISREAAETSALAEKSKLLSEILEKYSGRP